MYTNFCAYVTQISIIYNLCVCVCVCLHDYGCLDVYNYPNEYICIIFIVRFCHEIKQNG